jgi:lysophospholipase L1-like esterase
MRSRFRQALYVATLAVASVAVTLALFELGLRVFWGGYYEKFDPTRPWGNLEFHPVRGWANSPGIRVVGASEEYVTTLTHNSLGLRGGELSARKPDGAARVLVVGDSMTYGLGVEDGETYPAVLDHLAPDLEVVNLGVQGYSGAQELLLLRELAPRLAPNLVVIAFFWNDLTESFAPDYVTVTLEDGELHWIQPEPATADHPAFADRNRRARRRTERYEGFWSNTWTNRFVSDRVKLLRARLRDMTTGRRDSFRELSAGELEPAWQLTYEIIREMAREARRAGALPVLLILPDQTQVEPDVHVLGVPAYLPKVQERMTAFARAERLPVVDLLPAFVETRQRTGEPLYHRYDRHWNAAGHALAARVLHAELARLGLP